MVLRVEDKGCGRGALEIVAQDMSQVATESLGSEIVFKLRV